VFLGILFLVTGFEKAVDPSTLIRVISFDGFGAPMVRILTWSIVCFEIALGQLLLVGLWHRKSLAVAIITLSIYTGQLAFLLFKEHGPDCGCLKLVNTYVEVRNSNFIGVLRNCILILLAWMACRKRSKFVPDRIEL
jgi:hypothetical protein